MTAAQRRSTQPQASSAIRSARPVGPYVAALISLLGLGFAAIRYETTRRADRSSVLIIIEDLGEHERRADSILLATWWDQCDTITMTALPRDLTLSPTAEPLAALYEILGARDMATELEDALDIRIGAVATTDLNGVQQITTAIGAIPIDLPQESRDPSTGFHDGPGIVELVGESAVSYLRSRTWEERNDDGWAVTETSDLDRIRRSQKFAIAVIAKVKSARLDTTRDITETTAAYTHVEVVDHLTLAGFANATRTVDQLRFETLDVMPEQDTSERLSPFEPNDIGAANRFVLMDAPHAAMLGCDGSDGS